MKNTPSSNPPIQRQSPPERSPYNIPNTLTLIRILSIPWVVYFLYGKAAPTDHIWAAVIFGLAFWTDFFDGLLARRMQRITRLGQVMDPVADKLMVVAAAFMLVYLDYANVLIVIVLVSREMAVNALRTLAGVEGISIKPCMAGRLKVFGEGFGIGFMLLGPSVEWFGVPWMEVGRLLLYVGVGLAIYSGVIYFRNYVRMSTTTSLPS